MSTVKQRLASRSSSWDLISTPDQAQSPNASVSISMSTKLCLHWLVSKLVVDVVVVIPNLLRPVLLLSRSNRPRINYSKYIKENNMYILKRKQLAHCKLSGLCTSTFLCLDSHLVWNLYIVWMPLDNGLWFSETWNWRYAARQSCLFPSSGFGKSRSFWKNFFGVVANDLPTANTSLAPTRSQAPRWISQRLTTQRAWLWTVVRVRAKNALFLGVLTSKTINDMQWLLHKIHICKCVKCVNRHNLLFLHRFCLPYPVCWSPESICKTQML